MVRPCTPRTAIAASYLPPSATKYPVRTRWHEVPPLLEAAARRVFDEDRARSRSMRVRCRDCSIAGRRGVGAGTGGAASAAATETHVHGRPGALDGGDQAGQNGGLRTNHGARARRPEQVARRHPTATGRWVEGDEDREAAA